MSDERDRVGAVLDLIQAMEEGLIDRDTAARILANALSMTSEGAKCLLPSKAKEGEPDDSETGG